MKIKIILHFAVTYLVADFIYNLLPKTIGQDPYWQHLIPVLIGFAVACLVGIGKELWDKYHDHESFDPGDLTIDFFSAIVWVILPKVGEIMPW